jgi:hypothetical protein
LEAAGETVVVLDDYRLIHDELIHRAMASFRSGFRTVIGSLSPRVRGRLSLWRGCVRVERSARSSPFSWGSRSPRRRRCSTTFTGSASLMGR